MKTSTNFSGLISFLIFVSYMKKVNAEVIKTIGIIKASIPILLTANHISWSVFHKSKTLQYSLLAVFFFLYSTTISHAATITSNASGNWSIGDTWVGGAVPGNRDNVVISSGNTVTLSGTKTTSGSLTVYGILQLAGNSLGFGDLQGTGTISNAGSAPTLTVGSDNTSTTFSGVIGGGAISLDKIGTGTLTLSGTNTYLGTTTVSAGTLKLSNASALGTTDGATSVTSGAVLDLNGINYSDAGALTLAGTGISSGGCLINSSATPATFAGNITLSTTAPTITASNPITLSGVISGGNTSNTNSLTVAGNSTLTGALTLSGNNTYTGFTTINSGALLKIGANNALGAGAPSGVPYYTMDANDGNSTIINSGGVLDLNGITYTQFEAMRMNGAGFSAAGNGCIINSSSTTAIYSGCVDSYSPSTLYVANPITFNGLVQCRYNNSSTKTGSSTLTLAPTGGDRTGPSGYTSAIIISSGTLKLGANLTETGSTTVYTRISSGAVLDLNGFTCARYLYLNGTGISGGALINSISTAATHSGLVILEGASSIVGDAGTIALSNTGTMTGATFGLTLGGAAGGSIASVIGTTSGTVTKVDAGTWTLSGLNTYTGTTTVTSGILRATNNTVVASTNGAFGNNASGLNLNGGTIQSNVATFSRPITVSSTNSGIDAYGSARTISSAINNATASSSYNLNVGGTTATSAEGQDLILSGLITNSAGTLSLSKIGTSLLTLSAANTFSGGTTLNAGQININHATAIGSGTFTICGGIIDNTSAGSITLSNNNIQNWNDDFTFTGSQSLNMGTGSITFGVSRQITVSANTLTVGGTINQSTISLTKAGNGTLSFGSQAITLNNITINAGTLTSSSGTVNLAGSFTNNGTFSHNNGTLNFNGTSAQQINGTAASQTFYTIAENKSAQTLSIGGSTTSLTLNGDLAITSGTFSTGTATSISVTGNFANSGTFSAASGNTITLNGTSSQSVSGTGSTTFYNLAISNTNGNGVILNNDAITNNVLTINTGSKFTITPAVNMNVVGTITNSAGTSGLVIKSSSSAANGSLIFHNTVGSPVSATVEMYSKAFKNDAAPTNKYKWQFFGIPIRSIAATPTFDGSYLREMREDDTPLHWSPLNNASNLTSFTGYEITQDLPITVNYQGTLENSDYSSDKLSYTAAANYPGQHLIANPYTAAIDISKIVFGNQMLKTVYLFNSGSYSDWQSQSADSSSTSNNNTTAGQYIAVPQAHAGDAGLQHQIPSMQAFLVRAIMDDPTATVSIPYSSANTVVKNINQQRIRTTEKVCTIIKVKGKRYGDSMWIFSDPNCSHNFDNGWDGEKFLGSALAPQIFSMEADGDYQVNSVNGMNNTDIGFKAGEDSIYTLTFTGNNISSQYSGLYLQDLQENTITDITQTGTCYSFTAQPTNAPVKRFKILTRPNQTNTSSNSTNAEKKQLKIFSSKKTIFVQNRSDIAGDMTLYDISGRFIQKTPFGANAITPIAVNLPAGTYIVKGKTASEELVETLIIR